jgi:ABC-type nitrate/sulfonate/bicarbonate transport system ATPase subunit
VGLEGREKTYPRSLSGGMAQRAALARALCRKSEILLLDEPFGALDAFTRSRLRRDLDELWRSLNVTVILVTHDIEEAVYLADRIVLMKEGGVNGEFRISLPRPRDQRSPEFQNLCRCIEDSL